MPCSQCVEQNSFVRADLLTSWEALWHVRGYGVNTALMSMALLHNTWTCFDHQSSVVYGRVWINFCSIGMLSTLYLIEDSCLQLLLHEFAMLWGVWAAWVWVFCSETTHWLAISKGKLSTMSSYRVSGGSWKREYFTHDYEGIHRGKNWWREFTEGIHNMPWEEEEKVFVVKKLDHMCCNMVPLHQKGEREKVC